MDRHKIQKIDNFEGIIRPINTETDIDKLAIFFNEIDDLWPGTWTHGISYDRKRAREFIEKRNALVNFVAFNPEGKLVGYCSVHRRTEEANVSYIGILGVHPSVLSKKYGKHLLLAAIEYSVKNGDIRQDLHTWASNLKAVPLYKKVGLQWVPNTSVYMQNYIPAILQNQFCKPYFERHPDWYLDQKRNLTQAPDDLTLCDMKIFEYNFESGNDSLTVIIDRYSRSIAGIKRKIDGEIIELILKQEKHEVFAGFEEKLVLLVNNNLKGGIPLSIDFSASDEFSLTINRKNVTVSEGESEIFNSYLIKDTTRDTKSYRKAPSIKARINIKGEILTLETGVHIRQPVNISSYTTRDWIPTGTQTLTINLKNHTKAKIEGELLLWMSSDITLENPLPKVILEPEGVIGVKATLNIPDIDDTLFRIVHCQLKMKHSKTMVFEIPVFISNDPSIAVGVLKTQKRVLIQNREICVTINLEGASVAISDLEVPVMDLSINTFDHGPPFGFSEFNQVEFKPTIVFNKEKVKVKVTSTSRSKPNLTMSRIIELQTGNPYISIWEEIENLGTIDDRVTVLVTPHFTNGVNLPLGDLYLGLDGEVIQGLDYLWPASDGDLPDNEFEPWACIRSGDITYFHIYQTEKNKAFPSRSKLTTLEKNIEVKALSSSHSSKNWIGISKHMKVNSVRNLGFYLSKQVLLNSRYHNLPVKSFLEITTDHNELFFGKNKNELKIGIKSYRTMPLSGTLKISTPNGWHISPESVEISNLNFSNPYSSKFEVVLPEDIEFGIYPLVISIKGPFSEIRKEISVLVFKESNKPTIQELPGVKNKRVFSIENDILKLKTSPDFIGCLTSLRYKNREILKCNFPDLIPSVFFNQDPGGLFNILIGLEDDFEDLKFFQEKFVISKVSNDPWYGVEYTVDVTERKSLKGLLFKASYEILGGDCNLVRVNLKVENPTSAVFQFISLSFLSVGFDGSTDNIISNIVFKNQEMSYALTRDNPIPIFGLGFNNIRRLSYKKDNLSFALISKDKKANLAPIEAGNMILGGGVFTFWYLDPGQSDTITFYLVPNDGRDAYFNSLERILAG